MTDTKSKKVAAALAAVNAYLQEEELLMQQSALPTGDRQPLQHTSIWSLSGRQDMMNMRQLIQMKAFSRF